MQLQPRISIKLKPQIITITDHIHNSIQIHNSRVRLSHIEMEIENTVIGM